MARGRVSGRVERGDMTGSQSETPCTAPAKSSGAVARRRIALFALALLAAIVTAFAMGSGSAREAGSDPELEFSFSASGDIYQGATRVVAHADGSIETSIVLRGGTSPGSVFTFRSTLAAEEKRAFIERVRHLDFGASDVGPGPSHHGGSKTLVVTVDGETREAAWSWNPAFHPVQGWFEPWIEETRLMARLEGRLGGADLERALRSDGRPMPRPEALREPLAKAIASTTNIHAAVEGIVTLAAFEEVDPWVALVGELLGAKTPDDRSVALNCLLAEQRIPEDHRRGLNGMLLAEIRSESATWDTLSKGRRERCQYGLLHLADQRDEDTLSAFPALVRESPQGPDTMVQTAALAFYGMRGLDALIPLLSAPEPRARRAAVAGLSSFLYEDRESTTHPVPDAGERSRILDRFRKEVIPRLEAMDADPAEERTVLAEVRDSLKLMRRRFP